MIGRETLRIAWGGITANKLRSGLTILGMTIGVASVIVLIAVGNGSSKAVQSRIQSLGTNVLLVQGSGGLRRFAGASTANSVSLTKADARRCRTQPRPRREDRLAGRERDQRDARLRRHQLRTVVVRRDHALLPDRPQLQARRRPLVHGRRRLPAPPRRRVGQEVVQELFAGASPVGQTMKVNGSNYEVVGVLAKKGTNGTTNEDNVVVAPITTVQDSLTGVGSIDSITVQAKSESDLNAAEAEVTSIIEERHKITDTAEPGFSILNQGSLLETSSETSNVFTTLLGEVAAISLLVGGIGVMNIMLVSVTERTREIGIRKAIGARRSDILTQFLTEAVLVSLIGGLAGVALGMIGSQFEIAGVHPAIATYSIFLAFGAAVPRGCSSAPTPRPAQPPCDRSRHCALSDPASPRPGAADEHPRHLRRRDRHPRLRRRHRRGLVRGGRGELPRRRRRRLLGPVPAVLCAIVLLAGGFLAGVLVEKGQSSSSSPTGGLRVVAGLPLPGAEELRRRRRWRGGRGRGRRSAARARSARWAAGRRSARCPSWKEPRCT